MGQFGLADRRRLILLIEGAAALSIGATLAALFLGGRPRGDELGQHRRGQPAAERPEEGAGEQRAPPERRKGTHRRRQAFGPRRRR